MRRILLILIVLTLGVTMSLWDVDKNSNNRISPQLNQSDQILQRVSNATTSVNPVTDATTTSGFLKTANGQILGNNGTNNVGLFGFDDTGTMVVKVAKPGYDANSATDSQLVFNSAQDILKVGIKGSYTWPSIGVLAASTTTGFYTAIIPHGLGQIPAIQCYIQVPVTNGSFINPWGVPVYIPWSPESTIIPYHHNYYDANGLTYALYAGADATNLYIAEKIYNTTGTPFLTEARPFTYYVYSNSAN